MNKTKKRIVLAAIALFNERGLSNVRNQDIAEKAEMSLSNFNYHFKTKRDLIDAVFTYMEEILSTKVYNTDALLTKGVRVNKLAESYFLFQLNFRFFYLDTYNILLTYPDFKQRVQNQIDEAIQVIKNIHYLAIGRGNMKPPPPEVPNLYDYLAQQMWIQNHFWFTQMTIRELDGDMVREGLISNFALSYPFLTEQGKENFKDFIATLRSTGVPKKKEEA